MSPPEQGAAPLYAGVPYDYASVVTAGSIVFTAGACPLDRAGNVVAPGDVTAQAHAALDNLLAVLAQHGAGAAHLVRTTIYVVGGQSDLVRAWDALAARLAPHRPPSTLLGVAALGYRGQLVEIDGIAALPPQ
ncbi:MAG: RidA family protein [Acidimicrobiales bacterium]|jgi:enamine deaminase RidA (YjgF/YER057c/UK114 family)